MDRSIPRHREAEGRTVIFACGRSSTKRSKCSMLSIAAMRVTRGPSGVHRYISICVPTLHTNEELHRDRRTGILVLAGCRGVSRSPGSSKGARIAVRSGGVKPCVQGKVFLLDASDVRHSARAFEDQIPAMSRDDARQQNVAVLGQQIVSKRLLASAWDARV